ncbi:acyltransferase family protein [Anaerophaga thermohalophila]|uniref:acyltransferase family protein n=1 Tax=Anaerophaga thermohalophila TaxID=177400 RepID=UPI000237D39F|nr:acyltransferase [Anaerophaga thermohalophila]
MSTPNNSKVYFPSLNGIRAIAAMMVFIFHIEYLKKSFNASNFFNTPFIQKSGDLGVTLFFVLSGFLITFLLLKEKEATKTISIKQFYFRRILRIWPLYFLILILTLFFEIQLNSENFNYNFFPTKLALYTTFFANIAYILYSAGGFPSQLWSVSSEEQFYAIWPHLIKYNLIRSPWFLLSIALLYAIIRFTLVKLNNVLSLEIFSGIDLISFSWKFMERFRIDCMAIGGTGAILYFNNLHHKNLFKIIYQKSIQLVVYSILVFLLIVPTSFLGLFEDFVFSFLFLFLIINISTNKKSLFNLEYPLFNFLGTISYGIYIYQFLVFKSLEYLAIKLSVINDKWFPTVYAIFSLVLTVLIAYLSYQYYEKPFLHVKEKFAKVVSGNKAKY